MIAFEKLLFTGGFGAYLAIFVILVLYLIRKFQFGSPKLIPGVPVIGLDGGQRRLKEAQHEFMYRGGEMVREGYEKVVLRRNLMEID